MKKFFKKNKWIKKSSAFSLIEVLISMALLTLIIGGVTIFSVKTIQAHTRSQAMQGALENARFAIESISKIARTSTASGGGPSLNLTSNDAESTQYNYSFSGGSLNLNGSSLVGGGKVKVEGTFDVESDDFTADPPNKKRGFITIQIKIIYNGGGIPTESDTVVIRSGVSTRY